MARPTFLMSCQGGGITSALASRASHIPHSRILSLTQSNWFFGHNLVEFFVTWIIQQLAPLFGSFTTSWITNDDVTNDCTVHWSMMANLKEDITFWYAFFAQLELKCLVKDRTPLSLLNWRRLLGHTQVAIVNGHFHWNVWTDKSKKMFIYRSILTLKTIIFFVYKVA